MNRINYLAPSPLRGLAQTIGAGHRRLFGAIAAALVLDALTAGIEGVRVAQARAETATLAASLDALAPALAAAQRTDAELARLRAVAGDVATVRAGATDVARDAARIGDLLPADVALDALRRNGASFALDGRAARVASVAEALRALGPGARLVSLHDDGPRGIGYAIVLEGRP